MKRWQILALAFFIIAVWVVIYTVFIKNSVDRSPLQKLQETVETVEKSASFRKKFNASESVTGSVFVPYWTIDNVVSVQDIGLPQDISHQGKDYIIYFGISATASEVNRADPGYSSLESFSQKIGDESETLLTLRMLNEEINTAVLDDSTAQSTIIRETIEAAHIYGFEGVVLDFEHSVIPTQKTTDSITAFIAKMSESVKAQNMVFAITIYGDTFYRARPYAVKDIEPLVDAFYIMTYDFHKSYGTPGPNFPLSDGASTGSKEYGYSLERLVADMYGAGVKPEKLVFVFGMYGYDWMVDDQNRPLKPAQTVTVNQSKSRYETGDIHIDETSAENMTSFNESSGQKHVVWFENERSAQKKIDYLMTEGISKVGYWAWGYY